MLLKKLAFATALTVAAFAVQAQAQEPRRGGTIRFTAPYGASFVSNDSHVSNQIQDEIFTYALHSMLYKWDAKNSKPELDLAKSVSVSADGKIYCSAVGMGNHWTTKKTHWPTITTSQLNTPCPKLGARARVYATDGVAICLQTPQGLRWRW